MLAGYNIIGLGGDWVVRSDDSGWLLLGSLGFNMGMGFNLGMASGCFWSVRSRVGLGSVGRRCGLTFHGGYQWDVGWKCKRKTVMVQEIR